MAGALLAVAATPAPAAAEALPPAAQALRRRLAAPALPDTARLRLLMAFCSAAPNTPTTFAYAGQGLTLAQRLGRRPALVFFALRLTDAYLQRQNLPAATRAAQMALRAATQPPALTLDAARATAMLGAAASMNAEFGRSRQLQRQALGWTRRAPANALVLELQAFIMSSMATAYSEEMGAVPAPAPDSLLRGARATQRQVVQLAGQLRDMGDTVSYRGHMANAYDNLGDLALLARRYDSATYYKLRSIEIFKQLDDPRLPVARLQHLANIELEAGHYAAAAAQARVALPQLAALDMPIVLADTYEVLAFALDSLGRSHEAMRALRRSQELREAGLGRETQAMLAGLQVSFDTERKEARIRQLTLGRQRQRAVAANQRTRIAGLALVLALLTTGTVVIGVLFVRLRRGRAQLAALAATKDRLYALVAHDLRGPVQALAGLASLLAHYLQRNDRQALASLPPFVAQAVGSVTHLLDNLLYWAASQTGELRCEPAAQPATQVLHEVAALYETSAQAHEITLHVLPAAPGLHVRADPQMLRTVLRNLVGNALKFTPAGGTVTLEATANTGPGPGTALRVRDTGPGLTPAAVAALLGPGTTGAAPRQPGARGETGTGLGLRLCQLFVQRHGGTLALRGNPGHGTVAEAWFPSNG